MAKNYLEQYKENNRLKCSETHYCCSELLWRPSSSCDFSGYLWPSPVTSFWHLFRNLIFIYQNSVHSHIIPFRLCLFRYRWLFELFIKFKIISESPCILLVWAIYSLEDLSFEMHACGLPNSARRPISNILTLLLIYVFFCMFGFCRGCTSRDLNMSWNAKHALFVWLTLPLIGP